MGRPPPLPAMHGRRRQTPAEAADARAKAASKEKARAYTALLQAVLKNNADREYGGQARELAAKLCALNPEAATAWNFRRRAAMEEVKGNEETKEARANAAVAELKVSEAALRRNPKSYCAWHHRRWVLNTWIASEYRAKPFDAIVERECTLTEEFLGLDARNFHGWGYRRFLAEFTAEAPETELAFSQRLIDRDLSNYSAWHHRSAVLPACHATTTGTGDRWSGTLGALSAAAGEIPLDALLAEQALWFEAAVTEPADQAAWVYARWVSGLGARLPDPDAREQVRQRDIKQAREVLTLEPDTTWALLHLANSLVAGDASEAEREEAVHLYRRLADVDADRAGLYREREAGVKPAMAQSL